MPEAAETDGIDELIRIWGAYIGELNTYRAVCLRHEGTAAVRGSRSTLRLRESFRSTEHILVRLRSRIDRMGGWEQSLYWPTEERKWKVLHRNAVSSQRGRPGRFAVARGVEWEGRAVLIGTRTEGEAMVVELSVPAVPSPLPELPVRIVADALCCLEYLIPDTPAIPLPARRGDGSTVVDYLQRVTPENLFASKLFFAAGAGK
jgi:hypothetical protein